MNRRVLFIICSLLLMHAPSVVWAQRAADSATAKPAAKVIDLDKLLVDDEEGDLLTEEKPAAHHKAVSDSADAGQSSTNADVHLAEESESAKAADSVERVSESPKPGRRGPPLSRTADSDTADAGPVVVEDGRTINFAQNLKEYRSPRLAMLLSLLVPGLGQAYSRSYIKASAFGAAEVAAIGVAIYLNSVAKSKKKDAYDFADEHFDVKRIENYDTTLQNAFFKRDTSLIQGKDTIPLPYDRYFYNAAKNKETYYYESIRGKEFTPGWDDCNLSLSDVLSAGDQMLQAQTGDAVLIKGSDGSRYELFDYRSLDKFYYVKRVFDKLGNPVNDGEWVLGHSDHQTTYNEKIDKSNSYRDAVNYMFYVILLNHIASAIDAGFTARAYNARLLGEDNSAWNRVSVEQQFVFTGSELSPGVALRLRF
jgi:hypothetical protein